MSVKFEKGMSLLEMLVVFVIVSLVSSVLVQGFGFGLSLYDRIQTRDDRISREMLVGHWFRYTTNALIAGKQVETSFSGSPFELQAFSYNSLLSRQGAPQEIRWKVQDALLYYEEDGEAFELLPLNNESEFEYLNSMGEWVSHWEPTISDLDIPKAVRLRHQNIVFLTAAVRVRTSPDLLLEESRRER